MIFENTILKSLNSNLQPRIEYIDELLNQITWSALIIASGDPWDASSLNISSRELRIKSTNFPATLFICSVTGPAFGGIWLGVPDKGPLGRGCNEGCKRVKIV